MHECNVIIYTRDKAKNLPDSHFILGNRGDELTHPEGLRHAAETEGISTPSQVTEIIFALALHRSDL